MPVQVIMPQFGESVNEGTITHWLKTVGDWVDEYEALVEINTDKVDAEVTSPASGVILEILIPEGQIAQAGTVLAAIGAPGEIPTSKIKTGGPAGDPRLLFQEDQEHAPAGEPGGSQPNKSGMEKPILPPVRMGRR